jgi:hypothetical protein
MRVNVTRAKRLGSKAGEGTNPFWVPGDPACATTAPTDSASVPPTSTQTVTVPIGMLERDIQAASDSLTPPEPPPSAGPDPAADATL